ncbi:MAG: phage holin family protein, partial [Olegusella sp.]|nr:phage holin family protein [Olegusella sp.]
MPTARDEPPSPVTVTIPRPLSPTNVQDHGTLGILQGTSTPGRCPASIHVARKADTMHFLLIWLATSVATLAATAVVPGIEAVGGDYMGPIMCALVLALVNASIKPIMK